MGEKWIKAREKVIKLGDICKRNPEWGPVLEKYKPEEIKLNSWTEDEEFTVSVICEYRYVACERKWEVYDDFDWTTVYDESDEMYKEMSKHGDKKTQIFFNSDNMLWLSDKSKRERQLAEIFD